MKYYLSNQGYRAHTVQSELDVIVTKNRTTLLQYNNKPRSKEFSILRINMLTLYINERIAVLFKDPPMTAFERSKN